jgi:DNA-binding transcriptional ArsR family regulator
VADWDFILAPSTVAVEIRLDEVGTLLNSLKMLSAEDFHSGLHEWISRTAREIGPERLKLNHQLCTACEHLHADIAAESFPELIQAIKKVQPARVKEYLVEWLREKPNYPGDELLMSSREAYLDYVYSIVKEMYVAKGEEMDYEGWGEGWDLFSKPEELLAVLNEHLSFMWENYLKAEWKRVKPMLEEAVDAFTALDYSSMTAYDAIETVTGRNMRGKDFFEDKLERAEKLVFIPNAHLGPYISWGESHAQRTFIFFFGARPPKNAKMKSTALSRSELLVRLNALADETRLKMIELLTQNEEMCAQDFITSLDLSQSSASRHLRQLTASGYLTERRRDVAKCYTLNPERIEDTVRALKEFLRKS